MKIKIMLSCLCQSVNCPCTYVLGCHGCTFVTLANSEGDKNLTAMPPCGCSISPSLRPPSRPTSWLLPCVCDPGPEISKSLHLRCPSISSIGSTLDAHCHIYLVMHRFRCFVSSLLGDAVQLRGILNHLPMQTSRLRWKTKNEY